MKKTISSLLCIVMTISLLYTGAFAQAGLTNFQKTNTYSQGIFTDVASTAWFGAKVLRKEVAAVVSRMALASLRVKFTIDSSATGTITTVADLLAEPDNARSYIKLAISSYTSAEYYLLITSSSTAGFAALSASVQKKFRTRKTGCVRKCAN